MNWLIAGIVAGVYLLLGNDIKLPAALQPKLPAAQYAQAQADLAKAKADVAKANAELSANKAAQYARTQQQGQYAQGAGAGAAAALAAVPAEHQTPEVKLAAELVNRSNSALEGAFGRLPADQVAEWQKLVGDALAAKGKEVEALRSELASKDAALAVATKEKADLAVKVPQLEGAVGTANATAQGIAAKAEALDRQIVAYAQTKHDDDAKLGSLDHYAGTLVRIIAGLILLYALIHYLLPCLAQSYPGNKLLTGLASAAKNITTAHA